DLAIEKAVENSDIVLVCLSNGSINKKGYVQKELRFALDIALEMPEETIFIIPLRLEECSPPRSLRDWQYADYFEGQRDRAFQRLLGSFKKRADSLGINLPSSEVTSIKKKDVILPKFYRRAIHLEYKINADAKTINDYLLQLYTGIAFFVEAFDSVYQVDTIEAFTPDGHNVFQWGFVASGTKETAQHGYTTVAGMKITPDPAIEPVPEMFLISISQGQNGVSILSFDTDVNHAHMFTTGLVQDLRKAFSVQLLNPSQYTLARKEEKSEEVKKAFSEVPVRKIEDKNLSNETFATEKNMDVDQKAKIEIQNSSVSKETSERETNIPSVMRKSAIGIYSWWARILMGSMLGLSVGVIARLLSNATFMSFDIIMLLIFVSGVAGLISYPHKFSLFLLGLGYFIAGVIVSLIFGWDGGSTEFFALIIAAGALYGFPIGAVVSRVLFWLKLKK
ncbi:MAG: TIR domain-containing protein, partial [bacterium]|nr:TIR domain-containing protein [bacterium]